MTEKILISTDKNGFATFQKAVQSTCDEANNLIELYHAFQKWERISDIDQFAELARDPKQAFDNAIRKNIAVTSPGLTIDPEQAARLFNINRDEFMNLTAGLPVTNDDCVPCGRVKVRPGKRAVSLSEFSGYMDYLNFDADGSFSVDVAKVDADLDKFNTYAETPEQIALYEHFTALVEILNKHDAIYVMPNPVKKQTADALHLHLSLGLEGKFMLSSAFITNEIQKLKFKKI